jgi:ATP-dependent helicase/nuclease subunit A
MNLIFNASAGTGKTWQVTELYAALVLGKNHPHLPPDRQPAPPEKILLMTFTDNAAAELRQRVSEKMIAAEKTEEDETSDRARRVLRSLPAANISTIHAFCAGLLREYALELGLSPNFQTLENEARDALLDEVLKIEIFQWLEDSADFREFCAGISVLGDHDYSLINTIRSLLEKSASRGLDLSNAEAFLPDPSDPSDKGIQSLCAELRNVIDARSDIPATLAPVFQWLEKWQEKFPIIGNMEEFSADLDSFGKFGRVKGCAEISTALDEAKEKWKTAHFYRKNYAQFRAFARCLSACALRFVEAKRARDAVDFGDQLLLARDLLKNKKFDDPLFDWMIVDEVQDTSRVQCEVIEALWERNTHLVICGDKKQSIYAWRSADPQVMPDLESAMEQRGGQKRIDLKTSYRSKNRVIEAVNELFGGIYDSYDALEPQGTLAGEKPCVEFLAQDNDESTTDDEMSAVARRIRLLIDGGAEWRPNFGHDGKTFVEDQPFNYGDILILLKRSTHQAVLEKALRDADIPYTSGGKGKALFEQQEVRDLLMFLQVLCEPSNDLALVGFLRSPFANLTDDEIVQLGWDGETFDHEILRKQFFNLGVSPLILVDSKNTKIKGLTPKLTPKWVAERLLRYRAQTGKKLASQLVREMVRETAFDAQLAGLPSGEQKLANFKKALDWIRAAERGGQVLLPDVVRLFEKYIKTPPRSGAAEAMLPDPSQNAVTIMTVHGAKGLTKRVCFVPDISFGDQPDKGFSVFSENTLELKITALTGEEVESPGWKKACDANKAVRDLESTNVFYVAMTRARDLVVLSGAGTKDSKGWKKLAEGFFENAPDEILCCRTFSEIPESEGFRPEALDFRENVKFQPLQVPSGIERKPVTSLIKSLKPKAQSLKPSNDRRSFGTLGHMVLEELAKNGWSGDIPALVALFGGEDEELVKQLEAAREILRKETAGAVSLFAEHPFVLKRGDVIFDGTIDLLAQLSSNDPVAPKPSGEGGWKIFDYKFTNESADVALATYSPQLAAYQEAVEKLHPGTKVSASLILIGETIQVISLRV